MRVLVVRIGAMGDVLHALPAVAALRARHPGCFIGWAIDPRWSDLLQMAGDTDDLSQGIGPAARPALIDRWYSVPTGNWKPRPFAPATLREIGVLRRVLQEEEFDVCVDMQGALKSAVVGRMAGAAVLAGLDAPRERAARMFYRERVEVIAPHVVEQGCELLGAAVGETLRPAKVPLPMDAEDELWASKIVRGEEFFLISPTAGWGAKVWPADRYGELAAEIGRRGYRVLVNAGRTDGETAARVVSYSDRFATAVPCSLGQLIALTRRAALVIAGDTGPLHLAAALERPVVGIYGPTSPGRNGPYGTRAKVLRDAGSVTSHRRVSQVEEGMLRISVDAVEEAAMEMLRGE